MGATQSTARPTGSSTRHLDGAAAVTGRTVQPAVPLPEAFVTALRAAKDGEQLYAAIQLPGTQAYTENCTCWVRTAQTLTSREQLEAA